MRERIARCYALGIGLFVVGLAAFFAERQNADADSDVTPTATEAAPVVPPPDVPPEPEELRRGRTVFEEQGCLRCHRVAGEGSPRSPLDGVGARLTPDRIRAYIVADDAVRGGLTPSVARAKTRFADLPDVDLDALVTYLAASRGDPGGS